MRKYRQWFNSGVLLGLFVMVCLLSSCSEIIEKNITDETPELISPADSVVQFGTLTFWWTEVKGATQYRLQLIGPSFETPQRLYLDTVVLSTKFDYSPDPGIYEWHVQGVNSAYSSRFSAAKPLEVLDGSDLGRVAVVLRSPANNTVTSSNLVLFSWQKISIADAYRFQLFSSSGTLADDTTEATSYQFTLPDQDGNYEWQVTAFNDKSVSKSGSNVVTLDKAAPLAPELIYPKQDSAVNFTSKLKFTWTRKSSDVKTDNFSIVNSNGNPVSGYGGIKLNSPFIEISNTDQLFRRDSTYSWTVISTDRAGNQSTPVTRSFKVSVQ